MTEYAGALAIGIPVFVIAAYLLHRAIASRAESSASTIKTITPESPALRSLTTDPAVQSEL